MDGRSVHSRRDGPIRVGVVAAVRLYREGLAALVESSAGLALAATASDLSEAAALDEHRPDVLVLALGPNQGAAVVRDLSRLSGRTPIVVVGVGDDDEAIAYAEAGAAGYVAAEGSADDVRRVVESVHRGETIFSPRVAALLVRRLADLAHASTAPDPDASLTRREREILVLIDEGWSNKEIARALSIEIATVKNHVHNILEKLKVRRRSQAAALVRRG